MGAQRLSASRIISGSPCYHVAMPEWHVLNAFRHHGLYRRPGAAEPPGVERPVLNAFRHHGLYRWNNCGPGLWPSGHRAQRLSASRIISATTVVVTLTLECSTPFGITDYIGRRSASARPTLRVLNAFRHHGLYRRMRAWATARLTSRCSTPFGITDYIGTRGPAIRGW